jgi:hypothetical protein
MRQINFTFAPEVTATNFAMELVMGGVQVHTERSNGTFRKVHFLVEGTDERELAEYVLALREGNDEEGRAPQSMRTIANALHVSIPSVRRMLNDLALTHELEDMDQDDIDALFQGAEEADTMVVTEDSEMDAATA